MQEKRVMKSIHNWNIKVSSFILMGRYCYREVCRRRRQALTDTARGSQEAGPSHSGVMHRSDSPIVISSSSEEEIEVGESDLTRFAHHINELQQTVQSNTNTISQLQTENDQLNTRINDLEAELDDLRPLVIRVRYLEDQGFGKS